MNKFLYLKKLRWLWLSAIIFFIDFTSKLIVTHSFYVGEKKPVFSFFNIYYIRNYGAAFSFLSTSNGWQCWFFLIVSLISCIILFILIYQSETSKKLNNIAYTMAIGGIIGNSVDRLLYGFVVDIFDFYVQNWHFATFNIADSAIFISTLLIFIKDIFFKKIKSSK